MACENLSSEDKIWLEVNLGRLGLTYIHYMYKTDTNENLLYSTRNLVLCGDLNGKEIQQWGDAGICIVDLGFPGGVSAGDVRDTDSISGLEIFPAGGHGNPLQYSCLENPIGRGAWQVQSIGLQSQTQLKWLSMHTNNVKFIILIIFNDLQFSQLNHSI